MLFETWPSGKAAGFGPAIRRFESYRLSLLILFLPFYCISYKYHLIFPLFVLHFDFFCFFRQSFKEVFLVLKIQYFICKSSRSTISPSPIPHTILILLPNTVSKKKKPKDPPQPLTVPLTPIPLTPIPSLSSLPSLPSLPYPDTAVMTPPAAVLGVPLRSLTA